MMKRLNRLKRYFILWPATIITSKGPQLKIDPIVEEWLKNKLFGIKE